MNSGQPTPSGPTLGLLDATARGRVTYRTGPGTVVHRRPQEGPEDASRLFAELMRGGLARVEPYDLWSPPPEVSCIATPAGEEVLIETARKTSKKKAGGRR